MYLVMLESDASRVVTRSESWKTVTEELHDLRSDGSIGYEIMEIGRSDWPISQIPTV